MVSQLDDNQQTEKMPTPVASAILSLLHEHDCVIVPALGAFITRRVAAAYDERRGLMLPPSKEVAFNADIRHSDGILADYLAQADGEDYTAAMRRVEAFAADVSRRAAAGDVVLLPRLGSLSIVEGRMVFEPAHGLNVLVESYGLSPVAARQARSRHIGMVARSEVRKVAASVAAVAALLLISPRTGDPAFVRADMLASAIPAPAPVTEAPLAVAEVAAEAETLAPPTRRTFCLVVASFLTRQEAQDYVASMRARGVDDLSILDYEGRCRVIAATFEDEGKAKAASRDLRSLQGFEKAWVLKVEQ